MAIPRLAVDCSAYEGRLCRLAGRLGSDRSVLNTFVRPGAARSHRHAYTPVYELLFAARRHQPLRIAEIGIERGAGLSLLRAFFPAAELFGFEHDAAHVEACRALGLERTSYHPMDVTNAASIDAACGAAGSGFNLVIDDSSHRPEDQQRVITRGFGHLAPGGTLIVEDIFEDAPEEPFERAIAGLDADLAAFILPRHPQLSGTWRNDKLLILVKRGGAPDVG